MTSTAFTLDPATVQQMIEQVVHDNIITVIESLMHDPDWLQKIENLINQAVVQRTVREIASTDINTVIHQRVDENLTGVHARLMKNFASNGIVDQSTTVQLTVMDEATVIENQLVANHLKVVGTTTVGDLSVLGSINTDNHSWNDLAKEIGRRTLEQIDKDWQDKLVEQVVQQIQQQGINFDTVNIQNRPLIDNNTLNPYITNSNIQSLGHLNELHVLGEAQIFNTLSVTNKRLGINTMTPESALSVWDEEVAVIIGKHKNKQAYVGTSRDHSLVLGVNREPQVEIDVSGLTKIKKLQIGVHKISHATQVPGWSGTRGDLVLNSNPGSDRVFAWVCLGAHKWQSLKSAE